MPNHKTLANNTPFFDWRKTYSSKEDLLKDIGHQFKPGWTDTGSDSIFMTDYHGLGFTIMVWNGGNSFDIKKSIRKYYQLDVTAELNSEFNEADIQCPNCNKMIRVCYFFEEKQGRHFFAKEI